MGPTESMKNLKIIDSMGGVLGWHIWDRNPGRLHQVRRDITEPKRGGGYTGLTDSNWGAQNPPKNRW